MQAPLAARRERAGFQTRPSSVLYVFEHKTKNILIHAPHTRTVAFWHISNVLPRISWSEIWNITFILYQAAIVVLHYFTSGK